MREQEEQIAAGSQAGGEAGLGRLHQPDGVLIGHGLGHDQVLVHSLGRWFGVVKVLRRGVEAEGDDLGPLQAQYPERFGPSAVVADQHPGLRPEGREHKPSRTCKTPTIQCLSYSVTQRSVAALCDSAKGFFAVFL